MALELLRRTAQPHTTTTRSRRDFGPRCVYKRFDDQTHGFCAARGDWSQPEVAAAATEAIGIIADFLNANL